MKRFLSISFVFFCLSFLQVNACTSDSVQISVLSSQFCEGGQITLIVFVDSPNGPDGTFSWSRSNGELPAGFPSTSTDPFVVINPFQAKHNGDYTVVYTNQQGCTSQATVPVIVRRNPRPYIKQTNHCYGLELYAIDSLHTAGPLSFSWLEDGSTNRKIIYTGTGGPGSNKTLTITNASGCSAQTNTDQLQPQVFKVRVQGILSFPEGDSTTLKAISNYPVKFYMWYRNNVKIAGAKDSLLIVKDTAQYRSRISTYEGCVSNVYRRTSYSTVLARFEESETILPGELTLYPNPANDKIHLGGLEPGMALIYDLTGRLYKTFDATSLQMEHDISDLIPGIYLLKSGDQTIRFVKQ